MFKFVKDRIIKNWPAVARIALDNGEVAECPFQVDLKLLSAERYAELAPQGDAALLKEMVTGWSGIQGEEGKELPATAENKAALANDRPFVHAVLRAYQDALNGEAAVKN
ncbi:hypothetical protein PVT67_11650 [Gallaecimonas kandeliae]|uniref:hypothetical protein n=1 Tax=Gallaecimonas kandeliae TaxID=3029055 RepID=UPI002649E1BA|nr:hypothetical protein [Gallaecimonas kandeliae]WKE64334.1 hypothetical protein PVT67_11650 [Gallaecimonas kandeliae]